MLKRLCYLGASLVFPFALLMIWGQGAQAGREHLARKSNTGLYSRTILIDAVLYDGYELNDADEAVALLNVDQLPIKVEGWLLGDGLGNRSALPPGLTIAPGNLIWIARDGDAFNRQFGFSAAAILTPWPGFANSGDAVVLIDPSNVPVDVLVYGDEDANMDGWVGPALQPYVVRGLFGVEGQVLYRKREQIGGMPVEDTNSANDWAQERNDPINGRKVRYPGWSLEDFFLTSQVMETAVLTVAIAPDNALESVVEAISGARESIYIETFTFENLSIGETLITAADRGVEIKILLEGSPPGGLADQEKYICRQLELAGGECWFMISAVDQRIHDRYRYLHGKFILIDNRLAVVSTENLSPNSMPADDKTDGTWGRRGVVLLTDASTVVERIGKTFNDDLDPLNHADLFRWQADHPFYGAPPAGFVPITASGGITYSVYYSLPAVFQGNFSFAVQQAPENSLNAEDGFLGIINRAGKGDTVWVQQLVERPYWGPSDSNRVDDPNPRLESYIAAARRGADVRLLLDNLFDDENSPSSNHATCLLLNTIADEEKLNLSCHSANPTGLGIHNKMILLHVAGVKYIHVGSINGSELSNKGNREVALNVQSAEAFDLLAGMFVRDTPHEITMPLVMSDYRGPSNHMLISEVLYDSYGQDEGEFIELINPTAATIDISGFSLADAVAREDFEDLRRFPPGTVIAAGGVLVVATSASFFWQEYGFWPDFEIIETVPTVSNLIDDPSWGDSETFLRLGNAGDEVILRDGADHLVDVVVYGDGIFPSQVGCPLLAGTNHSLERFPYWQDNDNCPIDFRDWPFPSPGKRP